MPPNAEGEVMLMVGLPLDATTRATLIDNLLQKLHDHYIFPDGARQMDTAIRAKVESGAYDELTTLEEARAELVTLEAEGSD